MEDVVFHPTGNWSVSPDRQRRPLGGRMKRTATNRLCGTAVAVVMAAAAALGPADHRRAGFAQRHHDHQRQATPAARPEIRRRDQGQRRAVEALVAAARRAAQGRTQRPADHDRRRRLRRPQHLRRRHPDAGAGSHRQDGPALHAVPFHRALLADARRADHRPQPSLGRLRRGLGAVHRLPRLQQHHPEGQGHHRPNPQGQRLCHLVVRQGPQHADLPGQPGRAVRPVAHRHGLRVLLRLRRRRHQPVAAEPLPQHHGHLSLRRQSGLEPDHRHGRRRHRMAEPAQPDRPEQAVLLLLRARRHARAASCHAGMDREDQRHAPVRQGLERAARADLRQPEAARRDSAGRRR